MKKILLITVMVFIAIIAIALAVYIISGYDNKIKTVEDTVESDKIKNEIKIAAISDLHCTKYGENQSVLLCKIEECRPDIVVLLGDIFDSEDDPSASVEFLEGISGKYRIYAVHGNHEAKTKDHMGNYIDGLYDECDIPLLKNKSHVVDINENRLNICGVNFGNTSENHLSDLIADTMVGVDTSHFTLLLNHRPETFKVCENHNIDLMLSGHAHGGQWAIPDVLNGLYAPNQGLFPEYAGGRYELNDSMTLIVSRGLANNKIIPRVYNPPEINLITLTPKK